MSGAQRLAPALSVICGWFSAVKTSPTFVQFTRSDERRMGMLFFPLSVA